MQAVFAQVATAQGGRAYLPGLQERTMGRSEGPKMKSHPYANLFPMMTDAEQEALTADIAENGLRQSIVRYQGMILDGRNRFACCEKAGVEPTFTDYEGDDAGALAMVESSNVRRDMTAGQRAVVAARRWGLDGYSKPGPKNKSVTMLPISLEALSKRYRIGKQYVTQARDLLSEASDLVEQVQCCTISLAAAYEELQERRKQSAWKDRNKHRVAKYLEAVDSGELSFEQALEKATADEREEAAHADADESARRVWHQGLEQSVGWFEKQVAAIEDDYLAWCCEPGKPGTEHEMTEERIDAIVVQLERIKALVHTPEGNGHVKARSAKGRARSP